MLKKNNFYLNVLRFSLKYFFLREILFFLSFPFLNKKWNESDNKKDES